MKGLNYLILLEINYASKSKDCELYVHTKTAIYFMGLNLELFLKLY